MLRWGDCPERWLARPDTRASAQTDRLHFAAKYQNIVFAKHCFLKHLATQTKGCSYGEAKTWLSKHCFLFVKLFVASKLRLGLHNWTLMYLHRRLILWNFCFSWTLGSLKLYRLGRSWLLQKSVWKCKSATGADCPSADDLVCVKVVKCICPSCPMCLSYL